MHTFHRLYSPVLFDPLESDFTYRKMVGGRSTRRKLLRCDLAQTLSLPKDSFKCPTALAVDFLRALTVFRDR